VTLKQGGAALRRTGVIFLFSCSVMGLAAGIPAWAALLVMAAAIALRTYGEHSSALRVRVSRSSSPPPDGFFTGT